MEQISISFVTMLGLMVTAIFGFLGAYILMPFALIFRDFLLLKMINKFFLNDEYWFTVRVIETDRAIFNEKYSKSTKFTIPTSPDIAAAYEVDGLPVTEEYYNNYVCQRDFHGTRFAKLANKMLFRTNFSIRAFKYFKLDEYKDYIKKRTDSIYNAEVERINKEKLKGAKITSPE